MIERLNYDIIYIENMSLFNDLKDFLLTFEILFKEGNVEERRTKKRKTMNEKR